MFFTKKKPEIKVKRIVQEYPDGAFANPYKPGGVNREHYYNPLERYARYLELKLQFDDWFKLSDEEKAKLKEHSKNSGSYTPNKEGGRDIVLPDCLFNCGNSPCGCEESYQLFLRLEPEFYYKKKLSEDSFTRIRIHLEDILSKFDGNPSYRIFNEEQGIDPIIL